jgi:hypothetical protein
MVLPQHHFVIHCGLFSVVTGWSVSSKSTGTSSSGPWVALGGSAFDSSVGTSVPLNLRRALYASLSSNPVNPEVLLCFRSFTILSYPRSTAGSCGTCALIWVTCLRCASLLTPVGGARLILPIFSIHATAASQVPRSNTDGGIVCPNQSLLVGAVLKERTRAELRAQFTARHTCPLVPYTNLFD